MYYVKETKDLKALGLVCPYTQLWVLIKELSAASWG